MAGYPQLTELTVANVLSEWFRIESHHAGRWYRYTAERGDPTGPMEDLGTTERQGLELTLRPDRLIFDEAQLQSDVVKARLFELALLTPGLRIRFFDEPTGEQCEHHFPEGVAALVRQFNQAKEALYPDIVALSGEQDGVAVSIAFQHTTEEEETIRSFANGYPTSAGGTHVRGFRVDFARTLNRMAATRGLLWEDYRRGLTAAVAVRLEHPIFSSQLRSRLESPEVVSAVAAVVREQLRDFLESHPGVREAIIEKAKAAAEQRRRVRKRKR